MVGFGCWVIVYVFDIECVMMGDCMMLMCVVVNLVDNGLKYGLVGMDVYCMLGGEDGVWLIGVEDVGVGIVLE